MASKKALAAVLSAALALSTAFSSVSAAPVRLKSDIENHWAETQLKKWIGLGVLSGYGEGAFKPDSPVTRAELVAMIDRVFGYESKADIAFTDVAGSDWFAGGIARAIRAGVAEGYPDGTFRPHAAVTREDAAVMLSKAFRPGEGANNAQSFADAGDIRAYAKPAVQLMTSNGYIGGYADRTFRPRQAITRAEAVSILDNVAGNLYRKPGVYSGLRTKGNAVVNAAGVVLKDAAIGGNLVLAEGIGDGDAFLDHVTVQGTTFVRGGGSRSVHIEGSSLDRVIVHSPDRKTRIVVDGRVKEWIVESPAVIELGEGAAIDALSIGQDASGTTIVGNGTIGRSEIAASIHVNGQAVEQGTTGAMHAGKWTDGNAKPAVPPSGPSGIGGGTTPGTNPDPGNPGTDPGTDPGTNPGTDPGTDPGTNPGTDPGTDPGTNPGTDPADPDWTLVWNDEFDGDVLDSAKWNFVQGGGGYGNNELQNYTNRPENVRLEDGHLVIEARKENFGGNAYTSGKIQTKNKGDWTYGKFEIRAKLPEGKGMWPAIWMMPTDSAYGGWPASGEIDIMELLGHEPEKAYGTIHYGNPYTHTGGNFTLTNGRTFADDYHVFGLEWAPGELKWFVDGQLYLAKNDWFSRTNGMTADNAYPAPFDRDFYLQLNLAVGGNWPGNPDATTDWTTPKQMLVDYVKVYKYNGDYPDPGPRPGKNLGGGWSWIREAGASWTVEGTPKALRLSTQDGSFTNAAYAMPNNILLRDAVTDESGDFEISTKIKFSATANFEYAGLIVYTDDKNYVSLGRCFSGTNQIRFTNGVAGAATDKNDADAAPAQDIYVKIAKTGNAYRGYTSLDGANWTEVGASFANAMSAPRVGVFTRKVGPASKVAEFSAFEMNGVPISY